MSEGGNTSSKEAPVTTTAAPDGVNPETTAAAAEVTPTEGTDTNEPVKEEPAPPKKFVGKDDELPVIIVGPDNEEIFPEDILVPPDGGWGWVIVFAAFMTNVIIDGSIFTFGTLLAEIDKSAQKSTSKNRVTESEIAWVGSIQAGFYLIAGPFVSSLSNAIGFRATGIAGCLLAFFAYTMTWFLNQDGDIEGPKMTPMFVFFGFLSGVGLCLVYFPSIIMVGYYFEKRRALATGIAVCGSGIGTFTYAPIIAIILKKYNWPLTILIEGCLILSCIVFVILYRPLRPIHRDKEITKDAKVILPTSGSITHVVVRTEGDLNPATSLLSARAPSGVIVLTSSRSGGVGSLSRTTVGDGQEIEPNRQQSALSTNPNGDDQVDEELSKPVGSNSQIGSARSVTTTITLVVPPSEVDLVESRVFRVASKNTLNKPMYRSHIFYPGDLEKIAEEENAQNVEWEAVPVQTVPAESPEEGVEIPVFVPKPRWYRFKRFFRSSVLSKMLDLSLLKSATFLILAFSGGLAFLAFFVPFTYLKKFAVKHDCEETEATILIAVIGASNTIGRVLCGFMADKLNKRVLTINNVALIMGGSANILIPLIQYLPKGTPLFPFFVIYAILFGLSIACFVSLRSILLVELLGLNRLTNGVGLLLLFSGIAAFIGTPMAGKLKEVTTTYDVSFYVAGSLMFISGVMCYPLHSINRWEKNKAQEKQRRLSFLSAGSA